MNADDMIRIISAFKWNTLKGMFGCAHNSIIGFISTTWINLEKCNSALDGAPSAKTGGGQTGHKYADIILCKGDSPLIVVEVETNVNKYKEKLVSIRDYLHSPDYAGIEFGLLVMTNLCEGDNNYRHNWDEIKNKVKQKPDNIVLVSIEKEDKRKEIRLGKSVLDKLRSRNNYYPWQINNIDYWLCRTPGDIREGRLL